MQVRTVVVAGPQRHGRPGHEPRRRPDRGRRRTRPHRRRLTLTGSSFPRHPTRARGAPARARPGRGRSPWSLRAARTATGDDGAGRAIGRRTVGLVVAALLALVPASRPCPPGQGVERQADAAASRARPRVRPPRGRLAVATAPSWSTFRRRARRSSVRCGSVRRRGRPGRGGRRGVRLAASPTARLAPPACRGRSGPLRSVRAESVPVDARLGTWSRDSGRCRLIRPGSARAQDSRCSRGSRATGAPKAAATATPAARPTPARCSRAPAARLRPGSLHRRRSAPTAPRRPASDGSDHRHESGPAGGPGRSGR